jgi:hypothetical protein
MMTGPRGFVLFVAGFAVIALLAVANHASADNEPPPQPIVLTQSSQNPGPPAATPNQKQNQDQATEDQKDKDKKKKSDRIFFVMPNFLTVSNESTVPPLHWKQKFAITAQGVFDPYEFAVVGILAGIRQAENAYPGFGQGFEGYAKRYGTAITDQIDGNFMVGAIYPSLLKTDPRYFQLGHGKFMHRTGYAISRLFVTRKDSGGQTFNLAESLGNGTAIGISNFYYPASDRGVGSSLSDWGVQMGIDAVGNELKEFWPDIRRHFSRKKQKTSSSGSDQ